MSLPRVISEEALFLGIERKKFAISLLDYL
jgi:hypothetical protein